MSDPNKHSLSDFQVGILAEMGITSWKLEDPERIAFELARADKARADKVRTEEAQVDEKTLDEVEYSQSHSAETQSPDEQVAETPSDESVVERQSAAGMVLLALTETDIPHGFKQDVLQACGLEEQEIKWIEQQHVQDYEGYDLLWKAGERVSLTDKCLVTPMGQAVYKADVKKQIWAAIQGLHGR